MVAPGFLAQERVPHLDKDALGATKCRYSQFLTLKQGYVYPQIEYEGLFSCLGDLP